MMQDWTWRCWECDRAIQPYEIHEPGKPCHDIRRFDYASSAPAPLPLVSDPIASPRPPERRRYAQEFLRGILRVFARH